MSKQAVSRDATPKLRFLEFEREWSDRLLEDVAPLQRGFDLPSSELRTGEIPVIYSNGVQNYHDKGMAKGPGLVTGRSGTIGKIHFLPSGDYWPHNTTLWVTNFRENEPLFVYYLFKLIGMERFASGSGVPTLNRNDVHVFRAHIPAVEEQKKIADCLASLDARISAETGKLDALKAHKQSLMHQLFPAEGESLPRLRFPGFEGQWGEVALATQVDLISGMHLAPDAYAIEGEIPYFTGPSDFSNDLALVEKWTSRTGNIGRSGDTLITVKGSGVGELFYLELSEVAMGRQLMGIRSREKNNRFAFQFLTTQRHRFIALAAGNLIPGLSRRDILGLKIRIPSHVEQRKIGDFLTSVDDLIDTQSRRITALQQHKKGLMQGLFPAVAA